MIPITYNVCILFITISLVANFLLDSCAEEANQRRLGEKTENKKPKVFGLGLSKTGTTSMSDAMELLNFTALHTDRAFSPFMHHRGEPVSLVGHYDNVDSAWDIPTAVYYRELLEAYPDAKFVLTIRDSQEWFSSFKKFLQFRFYRGGCAFPERVQRMFERVYGSRAFPKEEDWVSAFEKHNRDVQDFFSDRPNQLLTIDLGHPDSWGRFCNFLGVQDGPCNPSDLGNFPRKNTATDHKITDEECQAKLIEDIDSVGDTNGEKYAYVSLLCDPGLDKDSEDIRQLLVLKENIREFDQSNDIIAMVQGPISKKQRQLLINSGFKVFQVRKFGDPVSNPAPLSDPSAELCYRSKFHALRLTQYKKVIYLEKDLLLKQDVQHMFKWPGFTSFMGFNAPMVGSFAVMEPSHQAYADFRDISTTNAFDTNTGWTDYGHFPHWHKPNKTSDWSFPHAHSDVGLWYYYYGLLNDQLTLRSALEKDEVFTYFTGTEKFLLNNPNDLGHLPGHLQKPVLHRIELWNQVKDRLERQEGAQIITG